MLLACADRSGSPLRRDGFAELVVPPTGDRAIGSQPARMTSTCADYTERPLRRVGFADALIVFKALRTAATDGELLEGVYTFDAAMQRLPHVSAP